MCVRPLLPLFEVNPKKQMASKVLAEMIQLCLHPTKEQTKPWMENSELKMEKKYREIYYYSKIILSMFSFY